jgi:hypothetical protein
VAFVHVFKSLEALDKVLMRDVVVFGIEQMHYADRQENVCDGKVCDAEVVELSVAPNDLGRLVGRFNADGSWRYV